MPSLFDGLGVLLADVFGDDVTHTPEGGAPTVITAVFRRKPVEILQQDGTAVLMMDPTLRVPEPVASTIKTGDLIQPSGAPLYSVLNRTTVGSPDAEGSVIFELREVL
jgi:hypothetical protein